MLLLGCLILLIASGVYFIAHNDKKDYQHKKPVPNMFTNYEVTEGGETLKNVKIFIYSDNGTRCIQAPCPTNGKEWSGKTDGQGILKVPNSFVQFSMSMYQKIDSKNYGVIYKIQK